MQQDLLCAGKPEGLFLNSIGIKFHYVRCPVMRRSIPFYMLSCCKRQAPHPAESRRTRLWLRAASRSTVATGIGSSSAWMTWPGQAGEVAHLQHRDHLRRRERLAHAGTHPTQYAGRL